MTRLRTFVSVLAIALPACAGNIELPQQILYTQTNMRMEPRSGEMSTINYGVWALVPMCTPVRLERADEDEVSFVLADSGQRAHLVRYGKSRKSMHVTLSELFQPTCPDASVLPPIDQQGIAKGEALPGMSKQGVLLALGVPPDHRTPSLESDTWVYWQKRTRAFKVRFENGVVVAPPEAPEPAAEPEPPAHEETPSLAYTLANLHTDTDGTVSSVNYRNLPILPRCAKVELLDVGKKEVRFKLAETGVVYTYAIDGHSRLPMQQHLQRAFTDRCDEPADLNEVDRQGIERGEVLPGMTKAGVLLAVGYPPDHETPTVAANTWTYWKSRFDTYDVIFSGGLVERIVD